MQITKFLFSGFAFVSLFSTAVARADISVLIFDNQGMADKIINTGHSAFALWDICAETPTKLRACTDADAERGVVLNKLPKMSEENYEWIATPVTEFFYGARSKDAAPLIATKGISEAENKKRYDNYYSQSIANRDDKGRWTNSVGALYVRTAYEYRLPGFYDDEVTIMNGLNLDNAQNKSNYNIFFHNCADFTSDFLKPLFDETLSHSANGFGLHAPKAIAMNLTKLALEHPEMKMIVIKHPQISGDYPRSTAVMAPSENLYKNPMLVPFFLPLMPAALIVNKAHPFNQDSSFKESLTLEEQTSVFGTPEEWSNYKSEFHDLVAKAKNDASLPSVLRDVISSAKNDKDVPKKLMNYFARHAQYVTSDDDIEMKLQVQGEAESRTVGMTRETVMTGDHQIGYLVMLADLGQTIYASVRGRSSMEDFKSDWALMQRLGNDSTRNPASLEVTDDLYDHLFPFYTMQCSVNQMVKKNAVKPGGEYGHSLLYIKGACRDTSAAFPKLKMCETGDSQPTGAIVSLDSIYFNTKFIVMDGKDLLFNAGLGKDQPLTQDYFDQVVEKALKTGAAKGMMLTDGTTDDENTIQRSTQTDWAVSFARDAACVRIPMNQKQVQTIVDSLNTTNEPYVTGKKGFYWNEITDNCVTLIRDTLATVGLREPVVKPHGVFKKIQEIKEAAKSELPLPAMDLVKTIEAANSIGQIDTAENIYANKDLRNYFIKFETIPGAGGGSVMFVPMHTVGNELYTRGTKFIFDKFTKGANEKKWKAYLADPNYATVDGNLNLVLAQFLKIQNARKSVDESTELGKFAEIYNAWIDQSIQDIQYKLAAINAAQPSL